ELKDVFANVGLALGSYRYSVGSLIPSVTRAAWKLKKKEIQKEVPDITRNEFVYRLSRSRYDKEWGTEYRKPGVGAKLFTWIVRVVPKVGLFKSVAFRPPTPEVEKMFATSVRATYDNYAALLANVNAGRLNLPNQNFDLGEPAAAG